MLSRVPLLVPPLLLHLPLLSYPRGRPHAAAALPPNPARSHGRLETRA